MARRKPQIGLIWAQLSAYHVDRIEAVGRRLASRADLVAVEVSSSSTTYAWEESGDLDHARKVRLFTARPFERITWPHRLWAMFRELRGCDTVCIGIAYSEPDVILLSALLRLWGVRVIMMTASKYDDRQRWAAREWAKGLLLSWYSGAIVGGCRQHDYVRYLGFRKRPVLPGYNTVSIERIRSQARQVDAGKPAWQDRRFLFVGRFVEKKNLDILLAAYALYAGQAGADARGLTLAGDGPLLASLERQCADLGIGEQVRFTGFLTAPEVAVEMARGLALILLSSEEQWGLVINEALAMGLPILASYDLGARESLVSPLANGFLVQFQSLAGIAEALHRISRDETAWMALSHAASERAWFADSERFADAVELCIFPEAEPAATDHARFTREVLAESAIYLPTGA